MVNFHQGEKDENKRGAGGAGGRDGLRRPQGGSVGSVTLDVRRGVCQSSGRTS